ARYGKSQVVDKPRQAWDNPNRLVEQCFSLLQACCVFLRSPVAFPQRYSVIIIGESIPRLFAHEACKLLLPARKHGGRRLLDSSQENVWRRICRFQVGSFAEPPRCLLSFALGV